MKLFALLLPVIFSLSARAKDRITLDERRRVPVEMTGVVWNSTLVGLSNHIYINWKKDQNSENRLLLRRFFWAGTLNHWLYLGEVRFLNSDQLSLDLTDGLIYLGNQPVGEWKGHPKIGKPGDYGYQFYSHVSIDEKASTIAIDEAP